MGNISDSERKTTSGLIWRLSYTHPEHLAGRNGSMGEEKRKVECDGGQHDIDV